MAEIKTKQHSVDVSEFINTFADTEQKRSDSFELVKLMQDFTGFEPKMWGTTIIGFGSFHYKSERSRQEGDWPLIGFHHEKPLFRYMYSPGPKSMNICWKIWGNLKWEKPVFTLKNFPTSTRMRSKN